MQSISAGYHHSLFKSADALYITGVNTVVQLRINEIDLVNIPFELSDIEVYNFVSFTAIRDSSYILLSAEKPNLIGCGNNDVGQLVNGTIKN